MVFKDYKNYTREELYNVIKLYRTITYQPINHQYVIWCEKCLMWDDTKNSDKMCEKCRSCHRILCSDCGGHIKIKNTNYTNLGYEIIIDICKDCKYIKRFNK
jgi:RNase P subunit RPR2